MANLNWVDYILLAIFFLSVLSGVRNGLIKELFSIGSIIAAFIVASMFAEPLAKMFTSNPSVQNIVNQGTNLIGVDTAQPVSYLALLISYVILFSATILASSIIGYIFHIGFGMGLFGLANRVLGGVFGLGKGYLLVLVIIFVVQLTPLGGQSWWGQSRLVVAYQPSVSWLAATVSPILSNISEKIQLKSTIKNVGDQWQQLIR